MTSTIRNEAPGSARGADTSHGEIRKPTKEQVRAWLARRQARPVPLPSLEQIRQELGWTMENRHAHIT
ncbi:MAG TPA: hypothetical protein DHV59_13220 [Oxalobacteraceae bacterium]|nr:hypothetical protein [Oxalobacteraceae bacterium]